MNDEEKKRPEPSEDEATSSESNDEEVMEAPFDEEILEDNGPEEATDDVGEPEPTDPDDDDGVTAEEEIAALHAELESLTKERDEYLDSLLRLKAEFENSRKRQEREKERVLRAASERVIVALLPVLDNFDRALDAEGDIRDGVQATRDQLSSTLEQEGLLLVESDGEHFDPNIHEAVMSQPSDEHEEGTVIQTFERGYILNGRSIRPAKVIVSHQV